MGCTTAHRIRRLKRVQIFWLCIKKSGWSPVALVDFESSFILFYLNSTIVWWSKKKVWTGFQKFNQFVTHCAIENLTTMKLIRILNTCQIDLLQLVFRENGKNVCLPNGCKSDILCFLKPWLMEVDLWPTKNNILFLFENLVI